MPNTYTLDQLDAFPWIVSCDTLRTEDLLVRFWQAAEQVLAVKDLQFEPELFAALERLAGEDSSESDWDEDEARQSVDDLADVLREHAPAGFYFGSQEGDGACFGFWLEQGWADALDLFGFGNDDPAGWAELIARLDQDGIDPETVEDSYCGQAEGFSEEKAGEDYAQQLAEELGVNLSQLNWPLGSIDWAAAWRELEMGDGYRLHDIGGGDWLVFRAV